MVQNRVCAGVRLVAFAGSQGCRLIRGTATERGQKVPISIPLSIRRLEAVKLAWNKRKHVRLFVWHQTPARGQPAANDKLCPIITSTRGETPMQPPGAVNRTHLTHSTNAIHPTNPPSPTDPRTQPHQSTQSKLWAFTTSGDWVRRECTLQEIDSRAGPFDNSIRFPHCF